MMMITQNSIRSTQIIEHKSSSSSSSVQCSSRCSLGPPSLHFNSVCLSKGNIHLKQEDDDDDAEDDDHDHDQVCLSNEKINLVRRSRMQKESQRGIKEDKSQMSHRIQIISKVLQKPSFFLLKLMILHKFRCTSRNIPYFLGGNSALVILRVILGILQNFQWCFSVVIKLG